MEQTQCSKMLAYKIQMPGNHSKERIQHSEHVGSLKSGINGVFLVFKLSSCSKCNFFLFG